MKQKQAKSKKIQRKCYTEQPETYYPQHLVYKRKKVSFPNLINNPEESIVDKKQPFNEETNFGFSLTNQYAYILLHLKNKSSKNVINLNIPEVCVFVDKAPFDIVYAENGFIKSFRQQDMMKCRLRDLEVNFKECWKSKKLPKNEPINVVFKQKQVLMLSQTDFIIVCKKIKSDPFFKRLQYIQNKLPFVGQQIICQYDSSTKQQNLLKLCTQSLLGFTLQQQIFKQLQTEQKYLAYMNQKISMVLNYQHNIRITKGNFHYVKNEIGQYYLINVSDLVVVNLTRALKMREEKLKKIQQDRDKILYLSQQKQKKYRIHQKPQQIKKIQAMMKSNFDSLVRKCNILTVSQSRNQQIKNQIAFKKLHPQIHDNYKEILSTSDFKKTKQKLFGSTLNNRKPITIPSRYVLRSYNKVRKNYSLFDKLNTNVNIDTRNYRNKTEITQ